MVRTSKLGAVLAALSVLAVSSVASASSHREAPAISEDPAADNTDLWAWADGGANGTLHIVASWNPLEEPSGGPNFHKFSDDVLYEIHITKGITATAGGTALDDAITYQFRFSTADVSKTSGGKQFFAQLAGSAAGGWPAQTYTITKIVGTMSTDVGTNIPVAPPNAGPQTDCFLLNTEPCVPGAAGNKTYDSTVLLSTMMGGYVATLGAGEGVAFAGPRDDGFYVDLGGIFDLANLRLGVALPARTAQDGVAGFNAHTIAIDIPIAKVLGHPAQAVPSDTDLLGIWASSSRQKVSIIRADGKTTHLGPWQQVSRLGQPLVNEAIIGLQDKDKYNRTQPKDDFVNFGPYFLSPTLVQDAKAVGIYTLYGVADTTPFETNRFDLIDAINLTNVPTAAAHHIMKAPGSTGDVLRVDPGMPAGYPNGRVVGQGKDSDGTPNPKKDQTDVTDVLLALILSEPGNAMSISPVFHAGCGGPAVTPKVIGDCVDSNDAAYLTTIPYLAAPWRGWDQGHGQVTAP